MPLGAVTLPTWTTYDETRRPSHRRCPQCGYRMVEVVMKDFGPRWQCSDCRITVFATGGIQPWRHRTPAYPLS